MQGGKIISETLSSSVKLFVKINYLKLRKKSTRLWSSNENRAIYNPNKTYIPRYVTIHKHTIWIKWNITPYPEVITIHTFPPSFVSKYLFEKYPKPCLLNMMKYLIGLMKYLTNNINNLMLFDMNWWYSCKKLKY